jgi:hypothetical protein
MLRRAGLLLVLLGFQGAFAGAEEVGFDSGRWRVGPGRVVDFLGQRSLEGTAYLADLAFSNGVIEVDIAVDGQRCFPGIAFRARDEQNQELLYIRPHAPGRSDALQYAPVFNGVTGWQLYSGKGFTAAAEIPRDRFLHIRLEVSGSRARVYFDGQEQPALVVNELKRGPGAGSVGLVAPPGGAVHFARFSVTPMDTVDLGPAPVPVPVPGAIAKWQLSQVFTGGELDRTRSPKAQGLGSVTWTDVSAEPSGLVDVTRHVTASPAGGPACVLARAFVEAERAEDKRLSFGYSDQVSVFWNGDLLFLGDSSYRSRDPEFKGIVGLYDAVPVHLAPGQNELVFMVSENFGGWGFAAALGPLDGRAVRLAAGVTERWKVASGLAMPESAAFDPARGVVYVSSFNPGGTGFISRLGSDGTVRDLEWVTGLKGPAGLAVRGDSVFVVERDGVAEVDLTRGTVARRFPCPATGLLNDLSLVPWATIYVSDSRRSVVYRLEGDRCEPWAEGWPLDGPNGLLVDGNRLVVANLNDGNLVALDLATARPTAIVDLGASMLDGLRPDGEGGYVVSDYRGRVMRVSLNGRFEVLLDGLEAGPPCADLDYLPERRLLVVPSFAGNSVTAYELTRP